ADLHRRGFGDIHPGNFRRAGQFAQAGTFAFRARVKRDGTIDEGADVGLHRVTVFGQHRFLDPWDDPFKRDVDAFDFDPRRLLVKQDIEFAFGVFADGFIGIEEPRATENASVPRVFAVIGDGQCAFVQRQGVIKERGIVEIADLSPAFTARTHAADDVEVAAFLDGPAALIEGHRAGAANRGNVEGEGFG